MSVLRPASRLRKTADAGDAAAPCRRGEALVDYSGKRIGIVDPATGEIHEAETFVGVLGASNLTDAEATWTQQLPDWIGARMRMFRVFGGVPKLLVPDNLNSGVAKASFCDPGVNEPMAQWRRITRLEFFPRGGESQGTRRLFHTAPCSADGCISARGGLDDRAHSSL